MNIIDAHLSGAQKSIEYARETLKNAKQGGQVDAKVRRFWECECCGCLIVTLPQDDALKYKCPACKISNCEDGGKFVEITKQNFIKEINA